MCTNIIFKRSSLLFFIVVLVAIANAFDVLSPSSVVGSYPSPSIRKDQQEFPPVTGQGVYASPEDACELDDSVDYNGKIVRFRVLIIAI